MYLKLGLSLLFLLLFMTHISSRNCGSAFYVFTTSKKYKIAVCLAPSVPPKQPGPHRSALSHGTSCNHITFATLTCLPTLLERETNTFPFSFFQKVALEPSFKDSNELFFYGLICHTGTSRHKPQNKKMTPRQIIKPAGIRWAFQTLK